jgi:hypothetical protein
MGSRSPGVAGVAVVLAAGEAVPAVGSGQGGLAALGGAARPGSLIYCVSSVLFTFTLIFLVYINCQLDH